MLQIYDIKYDGNHVPLSAIAKSIGVATRFVIADAKKGFLGRVYPHGKERHCVPLAKAQLYAWRRCYDWACIRAGELLLVSDAAEFLNCRSTTLYMARKNGTITMQQVFGRWYVPIKSMYYYEFFLRKSGAHRRAVRRKAARLGITLPHTYGPKKKKRKKKKDEPQLEPKSSYAESNI